MDSLIFDCDGVLVDSEAIAEATLIELLAAWLPDLATEEELSAALGMTTANILGHLEARSAHRLPADATARVDATIEARLADELDAIEGVAEAIKAVGEVHGIGRADDDDHGKKDEEAAERDEIVIHERDGDPAGKALIIRVEAGLRR